MISFLHTFVVQHNTTTYYYIVRHCSTKVVSFFAMYFSFVIMADNINIGLYCKNVNLFVQSHVSIYIQIHIFDLIRFSEPVLWWVCEILVSHSEFLRFIHHSHSLVHCCKGTMMFVIFIRGFTFQQLFLFFLLVFCYYNAIRISILSKSSEKLILELSLMIKLSLTCLDVF